MKVLALAGKDTVEFLHRVTASGVRKLPIGKGLRALLLNGQSRMLAQFDLLRIGEQKFWLVSPDECFARLVAELERLHFSEEIQFSQPALKFTFREQAVAAGDLVFSCSADAWPAAVPGYQVVNGECLPSDFHFDRIGALVPWPGLDWDENTPALEAGVLPWIDRDKGCYPGQEVVEKSLNVGHPARVLIALEGRGPLEGLNVTSRAERAGVDRVLVRVPWKSKDLPVPGFAIIKKHY